jgi:hypothetical protein
MHQQLLPGNHCRPVTGSRAGMNVYQQITQIFQEPEIDRLIIHK